MSEQLPLSSCNLSSVEDSVANYVPISTLLYVQLMKESVASQSNFNW